MQNLPDPVPAVDPDDGNPDDPDAGDPSTWPAWTDNWFWALGPGPKEIPPVSGGAPASPAGDIAGDAIAMAFPEPAHAEPAWPNRDTITSYDRIAAIALLPNLD